MVFDCLLISHCVDVDRNPGARRGSGDGEALLSFMKGRTFQKCKRQNILSCSVHFKSI